MPGIVGIIAPPGRLPVGAAQAMLASLHHEPTYVVGSVRLEDAGIEAGWTAHAGSYADCQPIWNDNHERYLCFAGEHFGGDQTASGAVELLRLGDEVGPAFPARLNGSFSGLLVDVRTRQAMLFNDRFGLGRVYFCEDAGALYFASEAKALLRVLPRLRRLDPRSLAELIVCGCTLQDRSLFPDIQILPPGSAWTFHAGRPAKRVRYFDFAAWEGRSPLAANDYYAALRETYNRVLPRYFQGDQPVALSLTGGLDSRMIIAGRAAPPGNLPCYTFGGMYRESEDVRISREVARRCGQPHQVVTIDEAFFPAYLDCARCCVLATDGAMDVSGSVGIFANRIAREIAPVRMTGNYGSEVLRGHIAFKPAPPHGRLFSPEFEPHLAAASETYWNERRRQPGLSFITRVQLPWHHFARFAAESSQLLVRAPYLDLELVDLAYRAPPGSLLNKQLACRYVADQRAELAAIPTDRGNLRPPRWLPKGLFLRLLEIPPRLEYYFDYGMPDWLANVDRGLKPLHLEKRFLGQQKYYHFRTWYRGPLASAIKEVLLDPRALERPHLDGPNVRDAVLAHIAGTANYTLELHKLLTCELIFRLLIDSAS